MADGVAKATPRNRYIGALADALRSAQERSAVTTGTERTLGGGLPAMLLGQAPQVLDDASYGRMPVSGRGMTTALDPAAMDVAGLVPGMQAAKGKALATALMGPLLKKEQVPSQVGKVLFDAKDGIGATPNNSNVDYKGMTVMMKPSRFLKLAAPLGKLDDKNYETIHWLAKQIDSGKPLGNLSLYTNVQGKDFVEPRIMNHEGRHRAMAIIARNGDEEIPVHVFPDSSSRARHITDEDISMMQKAIVPETDYVFDWTTRHKDNFKDWFIDK